MRVWGVRALICSAGVVMATGGGAADLELQVEVSQPFFRGFVHLDICPCSKKVPHFSYGFTQLPVLVKPFAAPPKHFIDYNVDVM